MANISFSFIKLFYSVNISHKTHGYIYSQFNCFQPVAHMVFLCEYELPRIHHIKIIASIMCELPWTFYNNVCILLSTLRSRQHKQLRNIGEYIINKITKFVRYVTT